MKILSIGFGVKQNSFKGVTQIYSGEKPYIISSEYYHPDSSIEKTLDHVHAYRTNKIYFADPMEPISDDIKNKVDYVVYDNEPAYPDLNKELKNAYLGDLKHDYSKQFINIRDYFYRREKAGWADKSEAQYQQWQSAECLRLYNDAKNLIQEKNQLMDSNKDVKIRVEQTKGSIELTNTLLAKALDDRNLYEDMMSSLSKKQRLYSELKEEVDKDKSWNSNSERQFVDKNLIDVTRVLNYQKQREDSIKNREEKLNKRILDLNHNLENYENILQNNSTKLELLKEKLVQHFQDLKSFYEQQNIKKF